jgi:hypothetical protein
LTKQTQTVSGAFVVGGIGVVGSSIAYLQPPVLYFGVGIGLFLCVLCPLGIFFWNQRQLSREEEDIGDLSSREIKEILDKPPALMVEIGRVEGSLLTGYNLFTTVKLKNNRDIVLDGLEASIEITDLDRNMTRSGDFSIPDLTPREEQEQTFKIALGRRRSNKYKIICIIYRMGFEVARKHFTLEEQLFGYFRFNP